MTNIVCCNFTITIWPIICFLLKKKLKTIYIYIKNRPSQQSFTRWGVVNRPSVTKVYSPYEMRGGHPLPRKWWSLDPYEGLPSQRGGRPPLIWWKVVAKGSLFFNLRVKLKFYNNHNEHESSGILRVNQRLLMTWVMFVNVFW
jgi:hypothetical protein